MVKVKYLNLQNQLEVKDASYKATIKTDSGNVDINISDLPNKEFHIKNLLNFKVKKPSEESLNLLKDDLIKKGIDENSALNLLNNIKLKEINYLHLFLKKIRYGINYRC